MANAHGDFVWYELLTEDPDTAAVFYNKVIGLEAADSGMEGYTLFNAPDGTQVAGMMKIDDDMKAGGARPAWMGYVEVDDVDASAEKAKSLGGAVHIEPRDIPGVGRFAMLADPAGAPFYIMSTEEGDQSESFKADRTPGHVGWNECLAGKPDDAVGFYGELFGWTRGEAMDTPQGPYQMYGKDETMLGGMTQAGGEMPAMWNYYWWSDGVEDAVERLKEAGGQLFHGPQEIPGGDVIIFATDPQGAMFCLVGPK
ncbi:VOC family protein [Sphingomicrobium clamense]|uniref:VOC family protein n=1 Tax=Sphingomicrobium clamense TaxID=2851013 RepID=A0ABS6V3N3_9SPHN|nr:VOC family protein [Sphingomicrobium sp. B8]